MLGPTVLSTPPIFFFSLHLSLLSLSLLLCGGYFIIVPFFLLCCFGLPWPYLNVQFTSGLLVPTFVCLSYLHRGYHRPPGPLPLIFYALCLSHLCQDGDRRGLLLAGRLGISWFSNCDQGRGIHVCFFHSSCVFFFSFPFVVARLCVFVEY